MGIEYSVLSKDEKKAESQIIKAVSYMRATKCCYAFLVEKDTFAQYELQNVFENNFSLSREEAITAVAAATGPKDVIVSSTGMISRELFEYRTAKHQSHERDFLTVGAMGHASQIALGVALAQPTRRVWCFDGDGAVIMHLGSLAIIADKGPKNLVHVVFNNGAHDSVGGQPTVGLKIDLPAVAMAVGYRCVCSVDSEDALISTLRNLDEGPVFIEIKVKKGHRKDLGRPTASPLQVKQSIMQFLQK
jgi:phosphonopyruvate decarboxylase